MASRTASKATAFAGLLCIVARSSSHVAPPVALTAGSTCSARSNYHAVAYNPALASTFGVRADIETNEPALCSASGESPSTSSAWVMLKPQGQPYWTQSGYVKVGADSEIPNKGMRYLAQFQRPSGIPGTFIAGSPGTATHSYAAFLRRSEDRIQMTRDGISRIAVDYDVTGVWNEKWAGQWGAEAFHRSSDVPGTSSDPTTFNYIQKYASNGDLEFVTSLTGTSCCDRYKDTVLDAAVGGRRVDIWTDPR